MSNNDSTIPIPSGKPAKPSPDFPLTAHATRRWCKKIKGKLHYFGRWDDPEGAFREEEAFLNGTGVDSNADCGNLPFRWSARASSRRVGP